MKDKTRKFFWRKCCKCKEYYREAWGGLLDASASNQRFTGLPYTEDLYFAIAPFRWNICLKCRSAVEWKVRTRYLNWWLFRIIFSVILSTLTAIILTIGSYYLLTNKLALNGELSLWLSSILGLLALLRAIAFAGIFCTKNPQNGIKN